MNRFKVTFDKPKRTFYVRAEDEGTAFEMAKTIESILERPKKDRGRTLTDAVIEALQTDDE